LTGGLCPAGYKCPQGTVAPVPCEIGFYNNWEGSDECYPCPAGKYCDELGINSDVLKLKDCKQGYLCIEGATKPSPTDGTTGKMCDPGYYCPTGTVEMIPCPGGSYEPRSGSYQCQPCPAGYYCPENSKQPIDCPKGAYCQAQSSTYSLP